MFVLGLFFAVWLIGGNIIISYFEIDNAVIEFGIFGIMGLITMNVTAILSYIFGFSKFKDYSDD